MTQHSYEQEMILEFKAVLDAKEKEYNFFSGQGGDNRITIKDTLYYQFGDFRVETDDYTLIIEFESGGTISNLVKYWYSFKHKLVEKPIVLLHMYGLSSTNDYYSRRILWDFVWERMNNEINQNVDGDIGFKIKAKKYTYQKHEEELDIETLMNDFEKCLEGKLGQVNWK